MSCNVELSFMAKRETVSWLTDVIDMGDIEYDKNFTEDTLVNKTANNEEENASEDVYKR